MVSLQSILDEIPQRGQRQDATSHQKRDVEVFLQSHGAEDLSPAEKVQVANRLGCYDAADLYKIEASVLA